MERGLHKEYQTTNKQECTVEHIPTAHLDFERAICCVFTGFTKGAVFIIEL